MRGRGFREPGDPGHVASAGDRADFTALRRLEGQCAGDPRHQLPARDQGLGRLLGCSEANVRLTSPNSVRAAESSSSSEGVVEDD
ncbi:hypothetical protein Q3V23_00765 [Streptomyces sp. VNUA116]|uniref:hypothetical protein n=1 Tax=Streptomyces sp. VNUA116 TaxID=3062449 RepID=UPI002676EEE9|nr:hypothetical protein [Streptomyces sp. VNUA116]WKU42718.1 hypothetical protein Q3V23_00765 [Streptomyces sp. VNUA116]